MKLFILLEPVELAINPLSPLKIPQLFLGLLIEFKVVQFDFFLHGWMIIPKNILCFPQVLNCFDLYRVLDQLT